MQMGGRMDYLTAELMAVLMGMWTAAPLGHQLGGLLAAWTAGWMDRRLVAVMVGL